MALNFHVNSTDLASPSRVISIMHVIFEFSNNCHSYNLTFYLNSFPKASLFLTFCQSA
ncbi:transcriptional regulator [Trichinella spiralis]|uniref:transcriptional regulator n=1 Tax=Trichinella spiralis TaxID=6334 RepID=UPI0001EFD8BB|nr:transcriptional regulator [Trichinella spiralis]